MLKQRNSRSKVVRSRRAGIAGRRGTPPTTPGPDCDSRTGTDVRKAAADPNDRSRVIAVTTAFRRPPLCSSISSSALRMCQSWPRRVYAFHPGGANAVFADGSVRFLKAGMSIRVLAALVTRAGGEVVSAGDL